MAHYNSLTSSDVFKGHRVEINESTNFEAVDLLHLPWMGIVISRARCRPTANGLILCELFWIVTCRVCRQWETMQMDKYQLYTKGRYLSSIW